MLEAFGLAHCLGLLLKRYLFLVSNVAEDHPLELLRWRNVLLEQLVVSISQHCELIWIPVLGVVF